MPLEARITYSGRDLPATAGEASGLTQGVRRGIILAWRSRLGARIRWAIVKASAWTLAGGIVLTLSSWHQGITPW